jgi:hypothetical protein
MDINIYKTLMDCLAKNENDPDAELIQFLQIKVSLSKTKIAEHQEEIQEWLDNYPDPERLAGGPSYIELGAHIGDQGMAFVLMAIGKHFGWWDIMTGESLGLSLEEAQRMAGLGFLMISGYKSQNYLTKDNGGGI